jgi:hypothetical protein
MSPDPYRSNNGGPGDPRRPWSWNRYTYVSNDPINLLDPSGLWECDPEDPSCEPCDDVTCNPYTPPKYPDQQVEIDCDIKVFATQFGSSGSGSSFIHAYVEETTEVLVNGIVTVSTYQIFQAAATLKSSPNNKLCSLTQAVTGQCWLTNESAGAVTIFAGNGLQPPTTSGTLLYDSLFSPSECANVAASNFANFAYRDKTTTYNALTQNSNSWAYTFLILSGVPNSVALAIGAYAFGDGLPLFGWGLPVIYWL